MNGFDGIVEPQALRRLAARLRDVAARPEERPIHREIAGEERGRLEQLGLGDSGRPLEDVVEDVLGTVLANSMNMAHPRFFGFVPSGPAPSAWIFDAAVSAYNPFSGSWLESSGPTTVELGTIDILRRQVGLPDGAGGVFLSGGSIANMTALAVARTMRLRQEEWNDGVVYATREAHASVRKGLRFIGVPDSNVVDVQTDGAGRMRPDSLRAAARRGRGDRLRPFAACATFGTTNTGAVDPIAEIAEVCAQFGLWLHVDGAYGASLAFSPRHADACAVLSHADSLTWDPHKWLFQTYDSSCLLVKDRRTLPRSFGTRPDYLRDAEAEDRKPNFWDYGPEMTRPARAVRLWAMMQHLGRRRLGAAIDHTVRLAEVAAEAVAELEFWRVTSPPRLGIVTFRYEPTGTGPDETNALNAAISRNVFESGFAAVLTTRVGNRTVLRMCTSNPNATVENILESIRALDEEAQRLRA